MPPQRCLGAVGIQYLGATCVVFAMGVVFAMDVRSAVSVGIGVCCGSMLPVMNDESFA